MFDSFDMKPQRGKGSQKLFRRKPKILTKDIPVFIESILA